MAAPTPLALLVSLSFSLVKKINKEIVLKCQHTLASKQVKKPAYISEEGKKKKKKTPHRHGV
jgi:hypothetical protein